MQKQESICKHCQHVFECAACEGLFFDKIREAIEEVAKKKELFAPSQVLFVVNECNDFFDLRR
jgi:hypothetical protein